MTLWARLTWLAADPAALASGLERRLGVPGRDAVPTRGARLLDLGTAELEVRPWVREGPDDRPRTAGRLVLEPVSGAGDDEPGPGDHVPGPDAAVGDASRVVLVGIGWSTVELDRAEADLDPWLGPEAGIVGADPQLGARARLRTAGSLPSDWIVLLEPSTEGRAAASLARDGEGPCALYLHVGPATGRAGLEAWLGVAAGRGLRLVGGIEDGGPFGAQALVAGWPPSGPHVLLVEGRSPASPGDAASTIAP